MRSLILLAVAAPLSAQSADVVLRHATIYTVDAAHPTAQSVAIKDGKISYVGTDAGIARFVGAATRTIDLQGRFVYPGFADAHAHFPGIGEREITLNLEGTKSKDEMLARVAAVVKQKKPGEWVSGRGWIETFWVPQAFPTRQDLDRIAPNNPVLLSVRADGHALSGEQALRSAWRNIASDHGEGPLGGANINLDGDGQPTGMLIDHAQALLTSLVPAPTSVQLDSAFILAGQRELSLGWTQVQDAHGTWDEVERMRKLFRTGQLHLRLYKAITGPGAGADKLIAQGPGAPEFDDHLQMRHIKLVMDGALGSRGAALIEAYSDDPGNRGLITLDTLAAKDMLQRALRAGIQVETHIGDRANRMTLDMYAAALQGSASGKWSCKIKEPRWRIEHSQIVNPADIPRFKQLGIIASMQPSHAIGDLFFAQSRLGTARLKGAYAWETFFKLGVPVAGGTDAPVERGEPMIEFYAAVARKSLDGRSGTPDVWHPEERVTREQALKMFTWFPAFASFAEERRGSITVGKEADFTVLDQDIMTIPEAQPGICFTIVGGTVEIAAPQ